MAVVFLELLHHHFDRIGNLLVVITQDLLADNLRHKEARGLVGKLVFVEICGAFGQQLADAFHEDIGAKLVLGRDGQYLGIGQQRVPSLHDIAQTLLVGLVDLIDEQQHGNGHGLHAVEEIHVFLRILHHVGHIEKDVCVGQCRLREGQHHLLHLVVGLEYTRGIREDNLHVGRVDNAHDAVPGGLCLESGDADLLAHQLIHQRRLAHIGISYDIYESCLVHIRE